MTMQSEADALNEMLAEIRQIQADLKAMRDKASSEKPVVGVRADQIEMMRLLRDVCDRLVVIEAWLDPAKLKPKPGMPPSEYGQIMPEDLFSTASSRESGQVSTAVEIEASRLAANWCNTLEQRFVLAHTVMKNAKTLCARITGRDR